MSIYNPSSEAFLRRLAGRTILDAEDRDAILALPFSERSLDAGTHLIRQNEPPTRCVILLAGHAYRQKITQDGGRQIVAVLVPGDILDLQNLYLPMSDHGALALTAITIGEVPRQRLAALAVSRPAVARAMWIDTLVEASIMREWLASVGRRDAAARLAHLLCELIVRTQGLAPAECVVDIPMSQEQLGDVLGLTLVHVNRMLRLLEEQGLIVRDRRRIRVPDMPRLVSAAGFDPRYLHLELATGHPPA